MQSQKLARYNLALKQAILSRQSARRRPLTQREVARRADMDETRLSRIVRGSEQPTPEERKALSRVLRRPQAELFPVPDQSVMAADL